MKNEHSTLWDRVRSFDLEDPASPFNFTRRLARENRWSIDYTRRVVEEYKRFALLAVVAGHPVSPSDAVDQAWHLHLVYTRNYWDDFCGKALGKPLHHGPTRGGEAESAKYHDWYARTLDSYVRVFGAAPPADVWPAAAVRFGRAPDFARVNMQSHWVVPRPGWLARRAADRFAPLVQKGLARMRGVPRVAITAAALILVALVLGGCVAPVAGGLGRAGDLAGMSGPEFLRFYIPLALIGICAASWVRRVLRRNVECPDAFDDRPPIVAGKLAPYEAALLVQGPRKHILTSVALVRLVGSGAVEVVGRDSARATTGRHAATGKLDPIEDVFLAEAAPGPNSLRRIDRAVIGSPAAAQVEARLLKSGAVIPREAGRAIRFIPALLLAGVLAIGLWRIQLGLNRGRPVGFLVMTCAVLGVASAAHLLVRPWRTRKGDELAAGLRRHVKTAVQSTAPETAAMAFAVLGVSALPASDAYAALRTALKPPPSGDASGCGGASSGCGGGGGGCGGGGCGGCGG